MKFYCEAIPKGEGGKGGISFEVEAERIAEAHEKAEEVIKEILGKKEAGLYVGPIFE